MPELRLDLTFVVDRRHHLPLHHFPEALAQPENRDGHSILLHPQPFRDLAMSAARPIRGEKSLQLGKDAILPLRPVILFEILQRSRQDRMGPAAVKSPLRRTVALLTGEHLLDRFGIDRYQLSVAATLLTLRLFPDITHEAPETSQQERTQPALLLPGSTKKVPFDHLGEKGLCQIFGILPRRATAAGEGVERCPIQHAELFHRDLCHVVLTPCLQDDRPRGRRETGVARAGAIIGHLVKVPPEGRNDKPSQHRICYGRSQILLMPRLLHRLQLFRRLLIVSTLTVAGLIGFAIWQQNEQQAGQARSRGMEAQLRDIRRMANLGNRSREQAEDLASYMLEDLRDQLVPLGRTELLGDAATRTLEYFENLPPELITPATISARASILATLANVHHARGDLNKSNSTWDTAIALREKLVALEPVSEDRIYDLATALNESSVTRIASGDISGARMANKAALDHIRTLPTPDPVMEATTQLGLGECERAADNSEGALNYYASAISSLGSPEATDIIGLQTLMNCHNNSGFCHMTFGDDVAAQISYNHALVPARKLLEADPENRHWQKEIATLLNNIGTIYDERGDFDEARPFLTEALRMRESLVAWDPANTRWQLNFANSLRNLASLEISEGNIDAAIEPTLQSLRLRLDLLAREPGNTPWLHELQTESRRFSGRFQEADRPDLAHRVTEEVRSRAEAIARNAVASATWNQFLSKIYNDLSVGTDGSEALETRLNSTVLRARNLEKDPDDPEAIYQLAAGYIDLGEDFLRTGGTAEASSCFQLARFLLTTRIKPLYYRRETLIDLCIRHELELADIEKPSVLISRKSPWNYYDRRTPPADNWALPDFDDRSWSSGPGELGYGDGDESTLLDYGPDPDSKNITAWFRHRFNISDISAISPLRLSLLCDDGAVLYLNGEEVLRHGMPEGTVSPTTLSNVTISGLNEVVYRIYLLDPEKLPLRQGMNLLAVEVHQNEPQSSDLTFALELLAAAPIPGSLESLKLETAVRALGDALPGKVLEWIEKARTQDAP